MVKNTRAYGARADLTAAIAMIEAGDFAGAQKAIGNAGHLLNLAIEDEKRQVAEEAEAMDAAYVYANDYLGAE